MLGEIAVTIQIMSWRKGSMDAQTIMLATAGAILGVWKYLNAYMVMVNIKTMTEATAMLAMLHRKKMECVKIRGIQSIQCQTQPRYAKMKVVHTPNAVGLKGHALAMAGACLWKRERQSDCQV